MATKQIILFSIQNANDLVSVNDGKVVTTSLQIAEYFGKRHSDVLRAIKNFECSSQFQQRNFASMVEMKKLPQGGATKTEFYYITRDGFTFLAMGFTGKIAARFKEAYINAFNEMEQTIYKGCNEQYIVKQLVEEVHKCNKRIHQYALEDMKRIGLNGLPISELTGTFVSEQFDLKTNLSNLLATFNNNTVAGWYATAESIKYERELKQIKQELNKMAEDIIGKILNR